MHKQFQYTVIFLLLTFAACKKSNNTTVPATNPMPFANYADTIWGIMECDSTSSCFSAVPFDSGKNAYAAFKDNNGAYTNAGTVVCKNIDLNFQSAPFNPVSYYTATTPDLYNYRSAASLASQNDISWQVAGAGDVPVIPYTVQGNFPQYSDTLPTYLYRSLGCTVPLGAYVTGADSVSVSIVYEYKESGTIYFLQLVNVVASAADSAITFTPAQLSVLPYFEQCTMQFSIYRKSIQKFGGKAYVFITKNTISNQLIVY